MSGEMKQRQIEDSSREHQPLKVLIAVQAGGEYGIGSLERCRTIARILEDDFGSNITFWLETSGNRLRNCLLEAGCNVIKDNWSLPEAVRQEPFDKLVIDFRAPLSPSLVQQVRSIRPEMPIIALDNQGLGSSEVDAIIYPNAHSKPNSDWLANGKQVYSGADYAILGFTMLFSAGEAKIKKESSDKPRILVAMGSYDADLLSEKMLGAFRELRDCHIDLVVPYQYPYPEHLESIATGLSSTVTLHWRIAGMRSLMQQASLAVTTLSMTAYELAYLGVPAVIIRNQSLWEDLERFTSYGSAIGLDYDKNSETHDLCNAVSELLKSPERLKMMGERGRKLVNSNGARQVAKAILSVPRQLQSAI